MAPPRLAKQGLEGRGTKAPAAVATTALELTEADYSAIRALPVFISSSISIKQRNALLRLL